MFLFCCVRMYDCVIVCMCMRMRSLSLSLSLSMCVCMHVCKFLSVYDKHTRTPDRRHGRTRTHAHIRARTRTRTRTWAKIQVDTDIHIWCAPHAACMCCSSQSRPFLRQLLQRFACMASLAVVHSPAFGRFFLYACLLSAVVVRKFTVSMERIPRGDATWSSVDTFENFDQGLREEIIRMRYWNTFHAICVAGISIPPCAPDHSARRHPHMWDTHSRRDPKTG
jgi:hypothetical protein